LTINIEDAKDTQIKLEEDKLYFYGKGGSENHVYEITVEFYSEVDPGLSKYAVLARNIPMVIKKKGDDSGYWPRLIKDSKKQHWLKTDFNKWKDEDDSDDEAKDMQLEEMMQQMGNFNVPENDLPQEEEDSDDEELPDLE